MLINFGLVFLQVTLRKGYNSTDLKADLANLYQKTGLKNLGTVFLMTDAQVRLWNGVIGDDIGDKIQNGLIDYYKSPI